MDLVKILLDMLLTEFAVDNDTVDRLRSHLSKYNLRNDTYKVTVIWDAILGMFEEASRVVDRGQFANLQFLVPSIESLQILKRDEMSPESLGDIFETWEQTPKRKNMRCPIFCISAMKRKPRLPFVFPVVKSKPCEKSEVCEVIRFVVFFGALRRSDNEEVVVIRDIEQLKSLGLAFVSWSHGNSSQWLERVSKPNSVPLNELLCEMMIIYDHKLKFEGDLSHFNDILSARDTSGEPKFFNIKSKVGCVMTFWHRFYQTIPPFVVVTDPPPDPPVVEKRKRMKYPTRRKSVYASSQPEGKSEQEGSCEPNDRKGMVPGWTNPCDILRMYLGSHMGCESGDESGFYLIPVDPYLRTEKVVGQIQKHTELILQKVVDENKRLAKENTLLKKGVNGERAEGEKKLMKEVEEVQRNLQGISSILKRWRDEDSQKIAVRGFTAGFQEFS